MTSVSYVENQPSGWTLGCACWLSLELLSDHMCSLFDPQNLYKLIRRSVEEHEALCDLINLDEVYLQRVQSPIPETLYPALQEALIHLPLAYAPVDQQND